MGRWSSRELEELRVFSAQLYGKHVRMERSLAAQDNVLKQMEEELKHHAPRTHEKALYHRLHHRLQNIKASQTEQQEELLVLQARFQRQLQQQLYTTPSRRLAIVPPLPRPATTPESLVSDGPPSVGAACSPASVSQVTVGGEQENSPDFKRGGGICGFKKSNMNKQSPLAWQTDIMIGGVSD